jgi:hypothetical protein
MGWRGFRFVHHSSTLFCRAVPNPNLTIRHFFITACGGGGVAAARVVDTGARGSSGGRARANTAAAQERGAGPCRPRHHPRANARSAGCTPAGGAAPGPCLRPHGACASERSCIAAAGGDPQAHGKPGPRSHPAGLVQRAHRPEHPTEGKPRVGNRLLVERRRASAEREGACGCRWYTLWRDG